jgi:hypothetical protein
MATTDGRMEEEIRTIIESGEDTTQGWSDQRIVAEANRRMGGGTDAIDEAAMDRWEAAIAHLRSATDNDGQTRA